MSWLDAFVDDITALEEVRAKSFPIDISDDSQLARLREDFDGLFAPPKDGRLDPGDTDTISELWWQRFKTTEIEWAKKEAEIQRRLAPLYEALERASEQEWEEYARIRHRASWGSSVMQKMMAMSAGQGKDT